MQQPDEARPRDHGETTRLLALADQFENAVNAGKNLQAAEALRAIVKVLTRFFPHGFAMASPAIDAAKAGPAYFISDPFVLGSRPDPKCIEIVLESVTRFKEGIASGRTADAIAALKSTGLLNGVESPEQELARLELEAARQAGSRRLPFLPRMAKLALWLGDADKAGQYASEALSLVIPQSADPFGTGAEAIHDANVVAGLLAVRAGDVRRAKEFLLASVVTKGDNVLRMRGPDLTLADELLKLGERDAVIQFLEHCRHFWRISSRRLEEWITEIRGGKVPDFGPCLYV
jgi:hypothetical protein